MKLIFLLFSFLKDFYLIKSIKICNDKIPATNWKWYDSIKYDC